MDVAQGIEAFAMYAGPVGQLLHIGPSLAESAADWPDYQARFGLGPEDIPNLIRISRDLSLHDSDPDGAECWAPVHAWRALGQMRAEAAVEPSLEVLRARDFDDMMDADLPEVFGMIGPSAIGPIAAFLADSSLEVHAAAIAMAGLVEIALRHPECRAACVDLLAGVLDPARQSDPSTNGFAICRLIDLKAVEAIDAIRAAMREDRVDLSIPGDEEDVEIALGLREPPATPKPRYLVYDQDSPDSGFDPERDRFDVLHLRAAHEPIRVVKIGRNEPCPCGSGKKYKKCCLT